jgi:hypothetical protein
MKTYALTLNESQEDVIRALAKALNIEISVVTDEDEDQALLVAMEEGKKYGRLSDDESKSLLDSLGK